MFFRWNSLLGTGRHRERKGFETVGRGGQVHAQQSVELA